MSKPTTPDTGTIETTSVLVVGAGPVGLTLAMELEHHGVRTLLVERNTATTRHPKMDVTNGRSMELYRRLGVADDLRKVAVPTGHRTKVTWATDAVGWELASFDYPSVDETRETIRDRNDGTLPLEPWMRVSQVILEPALRVLQGWGASGLLPAYAHERRAVALRNRRAAARHSLVRAAVMATHRADMHSERRHGARTRQRIGREISDLGNLPLLCGSLFADEDRCVKFR